MVHAYEHTNNFWNFAYDLPFTRYIVVTFSAVVDMLQLYNFFSILRTKNHLIFD